VTRNVSKFEKIVYRSSWRDLISGGTGVKEFFNSHGILQKQLLQFSDLSFGNSLRLISITVGRD
jgi:hypothetical protein